MFFVNFELECYVRKYVVFLWQKSVVQVVMKQKFVEVELRY